MGRRIFAAAALVAALILGAGYFAWQSRLASVRSVLDTKFALAHALLGHGQTTPDALIRALQAPELHVVVEDHAAGLVYEWKNGAPVSRALPPPPLGAPAPPPGAPPLGPLRPRSPIERLAGLAIGRAPERIRGASLAAIVAPNVDALGAFLLADATATLCGIAAALGSAIWIVVGIARAERRHLERTLDERRAAAIEFQRFLGDAGHELRTPLTIVSGYVEILGSVLERDERERRILEGLRSETSRMKELVEKMLLLARLESPVSIPRLLDVGTVAADVVAQMQARFPERDLALVAGDRASVVIDRDDLHEALRNLIENALRYAPDSPVKVAVTPQESVVSIAVTDRGVGIASEEREKIFDRFYRGSAQTDAEGSGLGLAIVSRVAARWNGTIRLHSIPGNTTFTLAFPLADEV